MQAGWNVFWIRSALSWGMGAVMATAARFLPHLVLTFLANAGSIDFAGGTVIYPSLWVALAALVPFWIGAELFFRRRETVAPLRLYFIFIALFYLLVPIMSGVAFAVWLEFELGQNWPAVWLLGAIWLAAAAFATLGTALALRLWPTPAAKTAPHDHF